MPPKIKIEWAEEQLQRLAMRLDEPFDPVGGDPDHVCMALGRRARELHRGYLHCLRGNEVVASRALLRPAVELNILLRFLRQHPEHRTRLWHLETIRMIITLFEEIDRRPITDELKSAFERERPTDEEIIEHRRAIAKARNKARGEGVKGVSVDGYLIPPPREQVELINTPEVWHAYVTAYGPLSAEVHVGHFSFQQSFLHELEDGTALHHDLYEVTPGERALASASFASTLVVVSGWLNLGVTEDAERIRIGLVGM